MRRFAVALFLVAVLGEARARAQPQARYDITKEEAAPTKRLRENAFEAALRHDYSNSAKLALETYLKDRSLYGPGHRVVTLDICFLAIVHIAAGEAEKADHLFSRVLGLEPDPDGIDRTRVDETVLDLEVALMDAPKDFDDAQLFEELLHVAELKTGPECLAVAHILPRLSVIRANEDSLSEADELATRALHIFEKHFGPNDARLADILNKLAVYAELQCREEDSARFFVRAFNVARRKNESEGWVYLENYESMLKSFGLVGPARHVAEILGDSRCDYYPEHCGARPRPSP